ncbi:MAG: hypothetical protein NC318_13895 [Blautia sp.]|nr:hypothetical protein [Lachnoclostridium sp.]MCM1212680.1 hypothetical protein [Blautia sp.]
MDGYVQVTVRSKEKRWKEVDIRVHVKQPWEHILGVLMENGIVKEEGALSYRSLRRQKYFPGELDSVEAGIYTGDIIEVGGC